MIFRRAPKDPQIAATLECFEAVAAILDRAQRKLLLAIPTARHPGAPLNEALSDFEAGLDDVERMMPSWRIPTTETLWETCSASLRQSRNEARSLRNSPPGPTQFETLNARVGDVLAPLEDFTEAERALKRLG